jgi:hypothetical protein
MGCSPEAEVQDMPAPEMSEAMRVALARHGELLQLFDRLPGTKKVESAVAVQPTTWPGDYRRMDFDLLRRFHQTPGAMRPAFLVRHQVLNPHDQPVNDAQVAALGELVSSRARLLRAMQENLNDLRRAETRASFPEEQRPSHEVNAVIASLGIQFLAEVAQFFETHGFVSAEELAALLDDAVSGK